MKEKPVEINIYRSVLNGDKLADQLLRTDMILRPPLKVPYLVDNLWEWVRPEEYPSRRFAAFASPQVHLSRKQGPEGANVYRVEFHGQYKICQIKGYLNAKNHPDCISLPIFLFEELGDKWNSKPLDYKIEVGRLWIPTLSKDEVEALFREVHELRALREKLRGRITFWEDVVLIDNGRQIEDSEGELFFEALDGYYLRPITSAQVEIGNSSTARDH